MGRTWAPGAGRDEVLAIDRPLVGASHKPLCWNRVIVCVALQERVVRRESGRSAEEGQSKEREGFDVFHVGSSKCREAEGLVLQGRKTRVQTFILPRGTREAVQGSLILAA